MLLNAPHMSWHVHFLSIQITGKNKWHITETPKEHQVSGVRPKSERRFCSCSFPRLTFMEWAMCFTVSFNPHNNPTIQRGEYAHYPTVQLKKYVLHAVWVAGPTHPCEHETSIASSRLLSTQDQETQDFTTQTTLMVTPQSWIFQKCLKSNKKWFSPPPPPPWFLPYHHSSHSLHACRLLFLLRSESRSSFHHIFLLVALTPHTSRGHPTSLALPRLLTFVGIFPSRPSFGAVGNWTDNVNLPTPGHTNSCFSLSRTCFRTEI